MELGGLVGDGVNVTSTVTGVCSGRWTDGLLPGVDDSVTAELTPVKDDARAKVKRVRLTKDQYAGSIVLMNTRDRWRVCLHSESTLILIFP